MRMTHLSLGNILYTHHTNLLLKEVQLESKYYNMELNLDKCVNLTLNQKTIIHQILGRHTGPEKKVSLLFRYIALHCSPTPWTTTERL